MPSDVTAGYFGKLRNRADFVVKGLPESFLSPFNDWLEPCLASGRAALGKRWSELYLVSPVWHFTLSPGLCGPHAVSAVMAPSIDRSGREFPFIVAACWPGDFKPAGLATITADWLRRAD